MKTSRLHVNTQEYPKLILLSGALHQYFVQPMMIELQNLYQTEQKKVKYYIIAHMRREYAVTPDGVKGATFRTASEPQQKITKYSPSCMCITILAAKNRLLAMKIQLKIQHASCKKH